MKRIVVLCDGTWNRSDAANPTNVVRLARALAPVGADGVVQVPIYIEGVGTGRGVTRLARWSDKVLGGALGWGLMDNVVEAYRHIVFLHEPQDEIYLFGFSRGAFTARSLAGFIRSTGIIDRDRLWLLPEAVARYRRRDDPKTHPDHVESFHFRSRMSLRGVTSPKEAEHRAAENMPEAPLVNIAYLGVWDTVGALGVPNHLLVAPLLNRRKYAFHNTKLSRLVHSARHAIALDERRASFAPTRWTLADEVLPFSEGPDARYQERFFLGDHGSVGGGGDILDLSSIALNWMIDGAQAAGLTFDPVERQAVQRQMNPMGPLHNFSQPRKGLGNWITNLRPVDRTGPARMEELHASVTTRWAGKTTKSRYRPGSLKRVETELAAAFGSQRPRDGMDRDFA
ncbi:DUF2235 domain-containing protein [Gymnodinialimonas ulvae]|uniref:DUF2235 domain-containing protein n=1 Tax=Gymnodinialimonas ulvae TaxID=3126504 RepID=UPI0030A3BE03